MGLAHVVVLALALVTRLIVSIGRFVPSRPQWDERGISYFRESVNSGRVTAANTRANEGELNLGGICNPWFQNPALAICKVFLL